MSPKKVLKDLAHSTKRTIIFKCQVPTLVVDGRQTFQLRLVTGRRRLSRGVLEERKKGNWMKGLFTVLSV